MTLYDLLHQHWDEVLMVVILAIIFFSRPA